MNIILFGAPGSGKGSQSELLVSRKGMRQISTGDLFRSAIKNKTDLGLLAQNYMNQGLLVPDEVVIGMVEEVINQGVNNFILDGFPRTINQAESLEVMLSRKNLKIDKAIFLSVPDAELLKRLSGRRVCKSCGAVYHIDSKPTKNLNICDKCGGEVYQRPDDKEEAIEVRLSAYNSSTLPLKDYYKGRELFVEVDGTGALEDVYKRLIGSFS